MEEDITLLEKQVKSYNKKGWDEIYHAYLYASKLHKKQKRDSGEAYITHPLSVCLILSKMHADTDTLCAGLLHDVIEDTKVTISDLEKEFNPTVAYLVNGVTKISKMKLLSHNDITAKNLRNIIVSLRKDARIVIIKLADRLHNMRTLQFKKEKKQYDIALETLEIYVPLAYYIGSYDIKNELENISFKYLKPSEYKDLEKKLGIVPSIFQPIKKCEDEEIRYNNKTIYCFVNKFRNGIAHQNLIVSVDSDKQLWITIYNKYSSHNCKRCKKKRCGDKGLKIETSGIIDFKIIVTIPQLQKLAIFIADSYLNAIEGNSNSNSR